LQTIRAREAKKNTPDDAGVFFLVAPARENWKYILRDLHVLCNRLDELKI